MTPTVQVVEPVDRLAADLDAGPALLRLPGDSNDYGAVQAAVDATFRAFGRLDHAVANAGFSTQDNLAALVSGQRKAQVNRQVR